MRCLRTLSFPGHRRHSAAPREYGPHSPPPRRYLTSAAASEKERVRGRDGLAQHPASSPLPLTPPCCNLALPEHLQLQAYSAARNICHVSDLQILHISISFGRQLETLS
jgi:hypothetical protein